MRKATTPSFILTLKLNTSKQDGDILEHRFACANRIYNVLVRHARKQVQKLRQDKNYWELMGLVGEVGESAYKREISKQLSEIRLSYGLSEYKFHSFVAEQQHKYKKDIDANTAQKIATTAWQACEKALFGGGKEIHFRRLDDLRSMEGKSNASGIRFKGGRLFWNGLVIQPQIRKGDSYAREALKNRVKYCRIQRKPVGSGWHYYLQLILEGTPPQKHIFPDGRVGIDIGTSTVAAASEGDCILEELGADVEQHTREIDRIQRAMDRSRRATNPANFNKDGTAKKGHRKWVRSKGYQKLRQRKRVLERKISDTLKQSHEAQADHILSMGTEIYVEDMNFSALAKKAKETQKNGKGRFKRRGRFGKTIRRHAPAKLIGVIERKLSYRDGCLHRVDTWSFKASQYNHEDDLYEKKPLEKRTTCIGDRVIQRDLYSAFLLMNSRNDLKSTDRARCIETFPGFLEAYNRWYEKTVDTGKKLPSSAGIRQLVTTKAA